MVKLLSLVEDNDQFALLQTLYEALQQTKPFLPQGPPSWRELGVGWFTVKKQHELETVHCNNSLQSRDHAEVMTWLDMCNWAKAAYDAKARVKVAATLGINVDDVLHVHNEECPLPTATSTAKKMNDCLPAYYVALDHDANVVRIVIRGTSVLKDLLTDFKGVARPFMSGYAHFGMAQAARVLVKEEQPRLQEVLRKHPGYHVQFVGHSLGGGIAALSACILNWDEQLTLKPLDGPVTAVTFASPPVLTKELALQAQGFVNAIINNNDVVPRASMASMVELANEILSAKERLCEDHKVTAYVAGGAVKVAQESKLLGKALGQHIEAASNSMLESLKRSAVEWKERQQQELRRQQQQQARGQPSAGSAGSTDSRSSFFNTFASMAVGFIDAAVPDVAPPIRSKQAAAAAPPGGHDAAAAGQQHDPGADGNDPAGASAQGPGAAAPAAADTSVPVAQPDAPGAVSVQASSSTSAASTLAQPDLMPQDPQAQCLLRACAEMDEAAAAQAPAGTHAPTVAAPTPVPTAAAAAAAAPATAALPLGGSRDAKGDSQQQQPQKVHHLYNAGMLHFIKREGGGCFLFKDVPASQFQRVLIKENCVDDHGISAYRKSLTDLIFLLST